MNSINRKKFFEMIAKSAVITFAASLIPYKIFSSFTKTSSKKKLKINIHPSAVKRSDKV